MLRARTFRTIDGATARSERLSPASTGQFEKFSTRRRMYIHVHVKFIEEGRTVIRNNRLRPEMAKVRAMGH